MGELPTLLLAAMLLASRIPTCETVANEATLSDLAGDVARNEVDGSFSDGYSATAGLEVEENAYERINLPNIEEFATGLDFSTGERRSKIFSFTYEECSSGVYDQLHKDVLTEKEYCIPDQVEATEWYTQCSQMRTSTTTIIQSSYDYQRAESSDVSASFDQTTDVSVSVPVGPAEVGMETQVSNKIGFGKSREMQEYTSQMTSGLRSVVRFEASDKRWIVSLKAYDKKHAPVDYRSFMTDNFLGYLTDLEEQCTEKKPDFSDRLKSVSSGTPSKCESLAINLVKVFGTHFNKKARFGGKITQNTVYNKEVMTDEDSKSISTAASANIGYLFFKAGTSTSSQQSVLSTYKTSHEAFTYEAHLIGGDPNADNAQEWCASVPSSPAIIENSMISRISSFTNNKAARAALEFAILDASYCNGGRYYITNRSTGSGACTCPQNDDYFLSDQCVPERPNCGTHSRPAECHFAKVIMHYTDKRISVYGDWGSRCDHDGRMWMAQEEREYRAPGNFACGGYNDPPRQNFQGVLIHQDTSEDIIRKALSYYKVYPPNSKPADYYLSIWRPQCPDGFSSITDIGAHYENSIYTPDVHSSNFLACVADWALESCTAQWNYDSSHSRMVSHVTWWALRGSAPGYQTGDTRWNCGWFRYTSSASQQPDSSLRKCIQYKHVKIQ